MRGIIVTGIAFTLAASLFSAPAIAEPATYEFEGFISDRPDEDPALPSCLVPGARITGRLIVDAAPRELLDLRVRCGSNPVQVMAIDTQRHTSLELTNSSTFDFWPPPHFEIVLASGETPLLSENPGSRLRIALDWTGEPGAAAQLPGAGRDVDLSMLTPRQHWHIQFDTPYAAGGLATGHLTSVRRVQPAYFEGFDDGLAQNWTPKLGAWAVEGDDYRNLDNVLFSSTVYDGAPLPTDFDLFTDVYLSWGNTGNTAGILFNYRSASDFYEVRLNASGTAVLSEVIGGVRRIIGTASYPEAGVRRWAVVYVRKVSARTHIEINGVRVFEELLPKLTGGHAGVFSSWNMARFDNVLIAPAIPAVDLRYATISTSSREGFAPLSGTWSSANGYLRSSANQLSSIALYTPLALGDIYQISARVYSEWTGGTSNQSGLIYDYVNSNNYREALYNVATPAHAGAVILSEVVNGVRSEVARRDLPYQSGPLLRELRLTLLRENDLTLFYGLTVRQPHPPVPVRVGLLTSWNLARFDDVFVYDLSTQ